MSDKAKIICVANKKGGVGKTTTALSLASALIEKGYKVLIVDLDPQGNLSYYAGVTGSSKNIYSVLKGNLKIKDAIQEINKFKIIPSNMTLENAETEFTQIGRELILKNKVNEIIKDYDYIIYDTPPHLGVLTANALMSADEVIIPCNLNIFAITGIAELYKIIETINVSYNKNLKIAGILLTRVNSRLKVNADLLSIAEVIAKELDIKLFNQKIRASTKIEEAQVQQEDILSNKKNVSVGKDYFDFVEEYLSE